MTKSRDIATSEARWPRQSRDWSLRLVRRIKTDAEERLGYLFDGMTSNVEDALFEEMLNVEEELALASHFNIMRSFRTEAAPFRDEFKVLMNLGWVNLLNKEDTRALPSAPADAEALIRSLARRARARYGPLLTELGEIFSKIAAIEVKHHPLQPENLLLCFWYATDRMSLSREERLLLLPLFDRFVMDRIGQVYGGVNSVVRKAIGQED